MKIQIASDLHLEFHDNREYLSIHPLKPAGEILLLAGDIVPFVKREEHRDFFKFCSDNFKETYWIPGNHEYYRSDMTGKDGVLKENIYSNVHLLNNQVVELGGTRLIFSTLWTMIPPAYHSSVAGSVSDYHLIRIQNSSFRPINSNFLFQQNFLFIKQSLEEDTTKKNIVITHHVPTFQHYPEEYAGSDINYAFANDLDSFIESSNANIWVYGHHHRNTPAFHVGKTLMVTNQLGYIARNEQQGFFTDFLLKNGESNDFEFY